MTNLTYKARQKRRRRKKRKKKGAAPPPLSPIGVKLSMIPPVPPSLLVLIS
ncbi:MAG: hypothetical protein SFH39_16745 [Candidatus Magnetobacterium sp. LHC-1]|nr:hypothetical protein [Nitrospirota bacterium]